MAACEEKLYPNCDGNIWLRSCEEEVTEPLQGKITGSMPPWLRGSLLRNGPGSLHVGPSRFDHLFDSAALLHRFSILDGGVTYQCRFLRSNTFKRNRAANRIVVTEFGTKSVPDPCHTIFDRVACFFNTDNMWTDNALVSIYPFGDEVYALTESPVMHRIDPVTLDTLDQKTVLNNAIVCHTAHPHVMPNGDIYNVGMTFSKGRTRYVIVKFPHLEKGDKFKEAHVVGSMAPRWPLHPPYKHSFGVTENYFVIVEQPLTVSLFALAKNLVLNEPLIASLQWYPEYETQIVLISRKDGQEVKRYTTETLFFLHIINTYEQDGNLVVDLCAYKDAKVIDAMYVQAIETMQGNADYANWFRSRPKRILLPLDAPNLTRVFPDILADIGCELPRIHYDLHNGRPYRYFYAISSDVDAENPGSVIKVDTQTGETMIWSDTNCYPSEPVFVPTPDAKEEDDGVVLSVLLWGNEHAHAVTLLVVDARSMQEIARAEFVTPSPAPKCLHGWFLPESA